jgi:hypothetical protein
VVCALVAVWFLGARFAPNCGFWRTLGPIILCRTRIRQACHSWYSLWCGISSVIDRLANRSKYQSQRPLRQASCWPRLGRRSSICRSARSRECKHYTAGNRRLIEDWGKLQHLEASVGKNAVRNSTDKSMAIHERKMPKDHESPIHPLFPQPDRHDSRPDPAHPSGSSSGLYLHSNWFYPKAVSRPGMVSVCVPPPGSQDWQDTSVLLTA